MWVGGLVGWLVALSVRSQLARSFGFDSVVDHRVAFRGRRVALLW